jgi:hypothetical protein
MLASGLYAYLAANGGRVPADTLRNLYGACPRLAEPDLLATVVASVRRIHETVLGDLSSPDALSDDPVEAAGIIESRRLLRAGLTPKEALAVLSAYRRALTSICKRAPLPQERLAILLTQISHFHQRLQRGARTELSGHPSALIPAPGSDAP